MLQHIKTLVIEYNYYNYFDLITSNHNQQTNAEMQKIINDIVCYKGKVRCIFCVL